MSNICFDRNIFIIALIVFSIIAIYYVNDLNQKNESLWYNLILEKNKTDKETKNSEKNKNDKTEKVVINKDYNHKNVYPHYYPGYKHSYDTRAVYDKLTPPYRRGYYDDWTPRHPLLTPIPTQGYGGSFRKVGNLIDEDANNDDKYKILLLMGRQKHRNGPFEYYATTPKHEETVKFPIKKTTKIDDGETITVEHINKNYTTKIDEQLTYDYNPDFLYYLHNGYYGGINNSLYY
jgi:hypothetical protein